MYFLRTPCCAVANTYIYWSERLGPCNKMDVNAFFDTVSKLEGDIVSMLHVTIPEASL